MEPVEVRTKLLEEINQGDILMIHTLGSKVIYELKDGTSWAFFEGNNEGTEVYPLNESDWQVKW